MTQCNCKEFECVECWPNGEPKGQDVLKTNYYAVCTCDTYGVPNCSIHYHASTENEKLTELLYNPLLNILVAEYITKKHIDTWENFLKYKMKQLLKQEETKLSIGDKYEDGIIVSITDTAVLICKPQDEPEEMTWHDAMKFNDGWRLPTKDELNRMYLNKDKIGGFSSAYYWSSSENDYDGAWAQDFGGGFQSGGHEDDTLRVRCVRRLII